PLVLGNSVGVILSTYGAGRRVDEGQRLRAFGVRRREQRARLPTFAHSDERCSIGSYGVEDCPNVVHPRLERPELARTIRKTRPSLVEHDQARERGEAVVHPPPV